MNGAPEIRIDRNPNGKGHLIMFKSCHKLEFSPLKHGDKDKVYPSWNAAAIAAIETVINYGWPKVRGTANGIAKPQGKHTIENVFGSTTNGQG